MPSRIARGQLPPKPHTELRLEGGRLLYEQCLTRQGFDGPFTISYHLHRPQAFGRTPATRKWTSAAQQEGQFDPLLRRHFRTCQLELAGDSLDARVPLLFNDDVVVSRRAPTTSDDFYFSNADGDELLYVQSGGATLVSPFGRLRFTTGDYVMVPKGVVHRFELDDEVPQEWLSLEFKSELGPLAQYRNSWGQFRMDAPYGHRDFRAPEFDGPEQCPIRDVLLKRNDVLHAMRTEHSLLDVVGYDGSVYPWAFPILAFQPRVASVHLPPTIHGTFAARGVLVCSFVPRLLDFGPGAIPCPYPHASVDIDEVLFYSRGNFTSRRGVGEGSLTLHPRGIPHGPQPGRYEESIGAKETDELAVMLDCAKALTPTAQAMGVEDADYEQSFAGSD